MAFARLPDGYSEGTYKARRFGVTVRRSKDGRRNSLLPESWLEPTSSASTCTASQRARLHQAVRCLQKGRGIRAQLSTDA